MNDSRIARHALALLLAAGLTACSASNPTVPTPNGNLSQLRDDTGSAISHAHVMLTRELAATYEPLQMPRTHEVLYHSGTVQTKPVIYVVYWGFTTDPSGEAARLTAFYSAVGSSKWLSTVTQYTQYGSQHVASPSGQLRGTWYDRTNPVPAHPTNPEVAAEAVRLAAHFGVYDADAAYVVATPTGHSTKGFGRDFCAYHDNTTYGRSASIAFINLPYMTDAGEPCGAYSVNEGRDGKLDGVTIVGGHELSETQTDPNGGGWYDTDGNEIADKCAWFNLRNTPFGGQSFPTQPLWSNAASGCVQ